MSNVTSDNVKDLTVTAAATAATRRLVQRADEAHFLRVAVASITVQAATPDSVVATYTVEVNTPGATYSQLSSELSTNVAGGQFDSFLHAAVLANGGSPALAESTSDAVQTVNLVVDIFDSGDGSDGLSMSAIIGIIIGGLVFLIFVLLVWCCCVRSRSFAAVGASDDTGYKITIHPEGTVVPQTGYTDKGGDVNL